MKEYPNQIPSQRQRTEAGNLRTLAATPPRRRAEATAPRPNAAAPRPDSVTQRESVTRGDGVTQRESVTRGDGVTQRESVTRQDAATPQNIAGQGNVTPQNIAGQASATRRADSSRRRRTRTRSSRGRLLHTVLTASAAMYLLLFLVPFLFTSDAGTGAASLSGALKRSPDAAVRAEADSLPEQTQAEALTQTADVEAVAESVAEVEAAAPEPEPFSGQLDEDCFLRVLNRKDDEVSVMSMQEYLVCVLRGEMPGYFELDALKAQAVAARTYTRYMLHSGSKHGDRADICTSPACCQAYLSAASARQKWGYLPEDEEQKLRAAVIETDGETMLYDGEPILAVFHASSAGLTRTSGDVWSGDKPYLQPVTSPENADNTPNYYSHVDFQLAELQSKLRSAFPKANLSGDASEWLTDAERDAAGNVITIYVGGIKTQGSRVRSALGLRSACFTWEYGDGKASFYVTGYGHGVGLSQYGANQMAREGADYRAILTHYYTGVRIGGYTP